VTGAIVASGLRKRFDGGEPVMDGAFLDVAAGSVTAVTGPPGSGRTTLLRLLARTYTADEGEILLNLGSGSIDLAAVSAMDAAWVRRNMLSVLDGPIPAPPRSGVTAVLTRAAMHPRGPSPGDPAEAGDAARRALADTGLDRVGDAAVGSLHERDARGVAILAALLRPAAIYLLDDLFAGTPGAIRSAAARRVAELRADGATVLLTCRHEDLVPGTADTILHLEGGTLRA